MSIRDVMAETEPGLLFIDGYGEEMDKAIMGVVQSFNRVMVCYDFEKVIEVLMAESEMTHEEAIEYFDFNIIGAWVGDHTPAFFTRVGE